MKKAMNKLAGYLAPRVGYWYIRLVHATMRAQYDGRQMLERARAETGQYILAFWHSRFALMIYAYPDQRMSVVISRHRIFFLKNSLPSRCPTVGSGFSRLATC